MDMIYFANPAEEDFKVSQRLQWISKTSLTA